MLEPSAIAALSRTRFTDVTWVSEARSTNDDVVERALAGAPEGVVVVADVQTVGRGRRGRTWEAPVGTSLLVSVLLHPVDRHLASISAGLAALDACRELAGVDAMIKWPNDLVVDGSKLAGILADAVPGRRVVVGLGLNVDWGGEPMPAGATSLKECAGHTLSREELLIAYLTALEARCQQSPEVVMEAYRATCSTIGRWVSVELAGGGNLEGEATGIDDRGRLVVDGTPVAVGDVVHVR